MRARSRRAPSDRGVTRAGPAGRASTRCGSCAIPQARGLLMAPGLLPGRGSVVPTFAPSFAAAMRELCELAVSEAVMPGTGTSPAWRRRPVVRHQGETVLTAPVRVIVALALATGSMVATAVA